MDNITFRFALRQDVPLILSFIKELASYENMIDKVVATQELLENWIFERKIAEVFFAVEDGKEIGFALYFHSFSTFLGQGGMYLEDLYVLPDCRGRGCGRAILQRLAQIAMERGCKRLEWQCLKWNAPSIAFYQSLGAVPMDEWTVYRLSETALCALAKADGAEDDG